MTSLEYQKIKEHYGEDKANRSQVPLINHIDEGIEILNQIGASALTIKAYCLHPLVQGDKHDTLDFSWSPAWDLAKEYRDRANSYLCSPETDHIQTLSQLEAHLKPMSKECLQMLYADKVQNNSDFLIHHTNHKRFNELKRYFELWIAFSKKGLNI